MLVADDIGHIHACLLSLRHPSPVSPYVCNSLQAELCIFLPPPPFPPQYCPTFIKYSEDQGRIIVGIKSGLSEVSGSKLGFNSSRSEEENCLSGKTFLVNSSQFQPRWNLTAKQVIKCKVSSRTLKIPTMEMWSFMSIFGIHFAVRERRDELLSHCLAKYQI